MITQQEIDSLFDGIKQDHERQDRIQNAIAEMHRRHDEKMEGYWNVIIILATLLFGLLLWQIVANVVFAFIPRLSWDVLLWGIGFPCQVVAAFVVCYFIPNKS